MGDTEVSIKFNNTITNQEDLNKCIDKKIEDLKKWKEELNQLSIDLWLLPNDTKWDNINVAEKNWKYKEYMNWVNKICEEYWCSRAEMLFLYDKTINNLTTYKK